MRPSQRGRPHASYTGAGGDEDTEHQNDGTGQAEQWSFIAGCRVVRGWGRPGLLMGKGLRGVAGMGQ
ncbi:hypothetical protein QF034_000218 [Streptomyces africanus]|uniref:Uncharacterized protein n=1 Tax=Streptomyces africanus TaxID=231024 RepID=A0ABU0QF12_9ACTN|nr:hypothetical protein [Streptomyces africanus]